MNEVVERIKLRKYSNSFEREGLAVCELDRMVTAGEIKKFGSVNTKKMRGWFVTKKDGGTVHAETAGLLIRKIYGI